MFLCVGKTAKGKLENEIVEAGRAFLVDKFAANRIRSPDYKSTGGTSIIITRRN